MIHVAILGAGIGREHLAAFRALKDRFTVRAVVDQDLARVEDIRQDGDSFRALKDIDQALADPQVQVVDICLPPHLHASVTQRALAAGKHVICEKPLATSLADVDEIRRAAQAADRKVYPVFQYRWGPSLAQLRHLMTCGLTGQLQVAALETHWSRGADYYAVPWRGTWAGECGGAVLGHAIHNHDLLTHIAGDIACLSALTTTRVNEIETEDCASISFAMTSGALATSSITLGAATDETRLRFVFERLTATSGTAPYAPGAEPLSEEADKNLFVVFICGDFVEVDLTLRHTCLQGGGVTRHGGAIAFLDQLRFGNDGVIAFEVDEAHRLVEIKGAFFRI